METIPRSQPSDLTPVCDSDFRTGADYSGLDLADSRMTRIGQVQCRPASGRVTTQPGSVPGGRLSLRWP